MTPSNLYCFLVLCSLGLTGTVRWLHLICIIFLHLAIWSGQEPFGDSIFFSVFFSGTIQSGVGGNLIMTTCNPYSSRALCSLEWKGTAWWPHVIILFRHRAVWRGQDPYHDLSCTYHLLLSGRPSDADYISIVFAYLVDSVWSCKKPLVALTQLISILFRHHSVWGGKEPYVILILFQHHANWSVDRNGMISSCNSYSFPAPRNLEWTGTVWWPHVILIPFRHHIIESGQEPHDDPM